MTTIVLAPAEPHTPLSHETLQRGNADGQREAVTYAVSENSTIRPKLTAVDSDASLSSLALEPEQLRRSSLPFDLATDSPGGPTLRFRNGDHPSHSLLPRFKSDPVLLKPRANDEPASEKGDYKHRSVDGSEDDYCEEGSGHCEPPMPQKGNAVTSKTVDADTSGDDGDGGDDGDDSDSSIGDFVCHTAAAIERSCDTVKRTKQERPDWIRWWSF
ncbi:hypothetical protein JCM10908_004331 [Rhodotorula pacifica]|uniref:uncharacterized protein n=1 Tax=Rhodotorula pacifica TaxID=1495444 RepID=UPI00317E3AF9